MIENRDALRSPWSVMSLSGNPDWWSPEALVHRTRGPFWDLLADLGATLLVTREYEHFVHAISSDGGHPVLSVLRVPHPSGLVVDRRRATVHLACTRNPNLVMELRVGDGFLPRTDRQDHGEVDPFLVPFTLRLLPGCLYLHDLALVGDRLLGNGVGLNAVVDLTDDTVPPVWWPASIDSPSGPLMERNLLQLNSIAAGDTVESSFFTASVARPGAQVPGDPSWEIDRAGVIFSGETRAPMATGFTRPHSVRLLADRLLVDDSGYGSLCSVTMDGDVDTVTALGGWTRGLCVIGATAVVGTSRIITGYEAYAPGLDATRAVCGVHLVDLEAGHVTASIEWPSGDQIFGIDWIPSEIARGFLAGDPDAEPSTVESAWYRYDPGFARPAPSPPLKETPDGH